MSRVQIFFSAFTYQPCVCSNIAKGFCQTSASSFKQQTIIYASNVMERRNQTLQLATQMLTAVTEIRKSQLFYCLPLCQVTHPRLRYFFILVKSAVKSTRSEPLERLSWVESTNVSAYRVCNHQGQVSSQRQVKSGEEMVE